MSIYNRAIEIGGEVEINSIPNIGTTFKIELPLNLQG
jgi:chemotaxis protein histidine kinase CheA